MLTQFRSQDDKRIMHLARHGAERKQENEEEVSSSERSLASVHRAGFLLPESLQKIYKKTVN